MRTACASSASWRGVASARSFYRLTIGFAVAGVTATLLAVVAALSAVELSAPSPGALLDACRQALPAGLGWPAAVVLAALTAGGIVLLLFARSLARQLHARRRHLDRLAIQGRLAIAGARVLVFEGERPDAFCAGYLRPRIYVSRAVLELLEPEELEAVISHERHHRDRRDPLRLLVIRSLADALFFMPWLRRLGDRYAALAELAADEAAVRTKGAGTLASAMLAVGATKDPDVVVGLGPERADHLLGERCPRWELPVSLLAGALLTVAAVASLGVIAATATTGPPLQLAMLLAESCMVLMLALPLAAAALLLLRARPLGLRRLRG